MVGCSCSTLSALDNPGNKFLENSQTGACVKDISYERNELSQLNNIEGGSAVFSMHCGELFLILFTKLDTG